MSNNAVKVAVSEADLEKRGVELDSQSVGPSLPDFLGYILGLTLLWLIYTGYQSAAKVAEEPIAKISEHAATITESVKELAVVDTPQNQVSDIENSKANPKNEQIDFQPQGSAWEIRLNRINNLINRGSDYFARLIEYWFSSASDSSSTEANPRKPVNNQAKKTAPRRSDDKLEWF